MILAYQLQNLDLFEQWGKFYIALRPFQVNPPYQFLNTQGEVAKIQSLRQDRMDVIINENQRVIPIISPDKIIVLELDQCDVVEYLSHNKLLDQSEVIDHLGYASGTLVYHYQLKPLAEMLAVKSYWTEKLNHVQFKFSPSADKMINTLRSNLAYILINRDNAGIQPGSRSYERSWIRDGAMTSAALLKMGITEEVKQFFDWYSNYQFPNGKIPCVVDRRGPDPVPEHDSHGEFIYGILNYFRFSNDTKFLKDKLAHFTSAMDYIESLTSQRSSGNYK